MPNLALIPQILGSIAKKQPTMIDLPFKLRTVTPMPLDSYMTDTLCGLHVCSRPMPGKVLILKTLFMKRSAES
jgi:hypothetical protein